MSYHYTECGLDNVYLVNGYKLHQTTHGEGLSIEDVDGLHNLIGKWLIELPKPLNGAELRFLRTEMDMSQRNLAAVLATKEQTLRLWEKHRSKAIPGPADRLLRVIYDEFLGGDGRIREMVERLAELDQIESAKLCLEERDGGWMQNAA